ncbi:hypothetical protein EV146_11424 [Mesobacillus foraminis]|uniref:Uncharacterized protein n=1 Tax=Mesobacillus foraminis TaxID=279826 RepID=A0A4R2B1K5_9BACI|nr:hypothetical protein EV146_11424 [Mesobacillus foraminis]
MPLHGNGRRFWRNKKAVIRLANLYAEGKNLDDFTIQKGMVLIGKKQSL